jgi:Rieske Fe-S protein
MKITRRVFFSQTLKASSLIILPTILSGVLESCGNQNNINSPSGTSSLPTIQASPSNGVIQINIDSSSPLAKSGGAALIQNSSNPVLVERTSDTSFNAVTAICTHQGCLITDYISQNNEYFCPCHGSRFSYTGKVDSGPAGAPLKQYQTSFNNNVLSIKA